MSFRLATVLLVSGLLAGCGGSPWAAPDPDQPTPTPPSSRPVVDDDGNLVVGETADGELVPAGLSLAVGRQTALAGWSPGAATLSVRMTAQDAASLSGNYRRAAALDVGDYQAYTYQETTSNRAVVALVRKVDGVAATTVVEAGQFADYHGGGQVWRADVFRAPTDGGLGARYNYSGSYAGLVNSGVPAAGGPGGTLNPTVADRVTGRALITADFTEMSISGGVDQRTNLRTNESYADIALRSTGISANGTFAGGVDRMNNGGWGGAGNYAGAFSGDASAVAAILVFNPTTDPQLFEHGAIVLGNCATAGGPACP